MATDLVIQAEYIPQTTNTQMGAVLVSVNTILFQVNFAFD